MEDQDSDPESPSDTTAAQDDDLVQSDDSDQGELVKKTKRRKKEPENVTSPGIIYLSRIPPFMKPHKVRHLLSRYGGVGRIYLQPEDAMIRKRRMKFGGNKKQNFTEGWVEFLDKRVAKTIARALNNTPVGCKKRSYYHDDLWNIKYLSKFRWTHLTEKIAYEQAVREQKMRTEMSQAKRESAHYLANVDKGKEIEAIVVRKRKRGDTEDEVAGSVQRRFKQRKINETAAKAGQREGAHFSPRPQGRTLSTSAHQTTPHSTSGDSKGSLSNSLLRKIFS